MLMNVFLSHVMPMLIIAITLKAHSNVSVMRDFLVMGFYVKVNFRVDKVGKLFSSKN